MSVTGKVAQSNLDSKPLSRRPLRANNLFASLFRIAVVLTILLAFFLRIHDLDGQSMWNDEGLSVYRARQSISGILDNVITIDGIDTIDTNPPGYFLLLHLWRFAAGESVFALRFLGDLLGVLNVPLIIQLGKRSFDRWTGLAAGFLLALSPFHVWMSQEMRNYTLLLTLNLLALLGLFNYLLNKDNPRRRWWLALWGAASIASIYTHFFGLFIFAFGVLALTWHSLISRKWRPSRRIIIAVILLALLSLPIIWTALTRFRAGRQVDFVFVPLQHMLAHAASAYSVGIIPTVVQPLWRVAPVVMLAAMGAVAGWMVNEGSRNRAVVLLLLGYLLVPLLLLFTLSTINPLYNGPRHLLMSLPPFIILVAAGFVLPWTRLPYRNTEFHKENGESNWRRIASNPTFWRIMTLLLGTWMIISQSSWLYTQYTSPDLVKDDIRGLADYLSEVAQEEDLIVLHDTIIGVTFDYYYNGQAPWLSIPELGQQDEEEAITTLRAAGEKAGRIWLVSEPRPRTGFPRQLLTNWAEDAWPKLFERRFPALWLGINLEVYVPQPAIEGVPATATPADFNWNGEIQLVGYEAPDVALAGSNWQPAFYWKKQAVRPEGYSLSLRLIDEQGQIWAQDDRPLWSQYPPSEWPEEMVVGYEPMFFLPVGLPPGDYQFWMRIIALDDGQPLTADGQADVLLSPSITVGAASAPDNLNRLPPHEDVGILFGGEIELIGYGLPIRDARPGHTVPFDLYWRVHRSPAADYQLQIQMLDDLDQVVSENLTSLTRAAYPPTQWRAGEILHGKTSILVPASAASDSYSFAITLLDPSTGEPLSTSSLFGGSSVALGEVLINPWPLETELPDIANSMIAEFGQPPLIELHGYELSSNQVVAGDTVALNLFWRSLSDDIPTSYSVFVHLATEDETVVAQGDGIPGSGFRPTTSWRQGEVLDDLHPISIPAGTLPGSYPLWVGFYDPETGQRLPILYDGQQQTGDRLKLASITVSP